MATDTVNVPVLGSMNKGTALAGGLAAVSVGGFLLWKKLQKNKKAAAATAGAGGQYGYGQYAYGYGQYGYGVLGAYGYNMYAPPFGNIPGYEYYGYGQYGYGLYTDTGQYVGPTGVPTAQQVAVTTNAEWTQSALSALSNQGYNATSVLPALALYLAGKTVTADQASIIQAAIALEGYPPQAGASGNPPGIVQNQSTGQGGGGGGSGGEPPNQTGTVHSDQTNETARVKTTDGGITWVYAGVPVGKKGPVNQTGTVHSNTTGGSARVRTSNGGMTWTFIR